VAAPKIPSGILREEVALMVLEKRGVPEALSGGDSADREGRAYVMMVCVVQT
jgi:hypothetical protein